MPQQSPAMDHLILFLPSGSDKLPVIPPSLTQNFTITPGGTHADGLTANVLIILADGCYIELICFLPSDSSKISAHWWGPDANRKGWTDWCLTTTGSPEENWEGVKESHGELVRGGRLRPDGKEVKWAVTFPKGGNGGQVRRGLVPFFCHDVTPREVRVPVDVEKTAHPCAALGVQQITVVVKSQEELDATRRLYVSIFGHDGIARDDEIVLEAGRVRDVQGLEKGPKIVLRSPRNAVEAEKVGKRGFWFGEVVLSAKASELKEAGSRERIDNEEDDVQGLWIEYV